jgi:hypothetical protein
MNIFGSRAHNENWVPFAIIWIVAAGVSPAAFAQPAAAPFVVTTLADSGPGSLRQAILDANEQPGPDVIDFAPGLHGTILLTSGALRITDSVTIQGPGAFWLTVNGNRTSRIFEVEGAGNTVIVEGLTITQGLAQGLVYPGLGGGILLVNSSLTLSRVLLSENRAVGVSTTPGPSSVGQNGLGGGIFNMAGNLHIMASAFINNQAIGGNGAPGGPAGGAGLGGGIANQLGTLTLTNSALIGNHASGDGGMAMGGGISNNGALTVTNSTFVDNQALGGSGGSALGGGIALQTQTTPLRLTIQESAFLGNQAVGGSTGSGGAGEGGGIFVGGNNNLTINRAIIDNNLAQGGNGSNGGNGLGGGLFDNTGATVVINASTVIRNSALGGTGTGGDGTGGGIYNLGSLLLGPATVVSGNLASTGSPNVYPPVGGR